jgi:hypothetical protein
MARIIPNHLLDTQSALPKSKAALKRPFCFGIISRSDKSFGFAQAYSDAILLTQNAGDAGWSSPVARQAHNLKAAGSNPAPATKSKAPKTEMSPGLFCVQGHGSSFGRGSPRSSLRLAEVSNSAGNLRAGSLLQRIQGPPSMPCSLTLCHHRWLFPACLHRRWSCVSNSDRIEYRFVQRRLGSRLQRI